MADNSVLAANFPVYVNTGSTETPTWTAIGGVKTVNFNPGSKTADTGTFSNAGWDSTITVSRSLQVSIEGIAQYEEVDGEFVKDAGQAAVEVYGDAVGRAARGDFLIALPGNTTGLRFKGDVASVVKFGGSRDEVAQWKADINVSEPAVEIVLD